VLIDPNLGANDQKCPEVLYHTKKNTKKPSVLGGFIPKRQAYCSFGLVSPALYLQNGESQTAICLPFAILGKHVAV